ncbi:MAG: methyltransferase domain-containing protein [Candidatus Pacebacteria bacterium]|nr:methyltransferase domain-containing protein [Candidatus Paceibacterota bacterium]
MFKTASIFNTASKIEAAKAEIVAKWGAWTAEQIDLGHGVFTGGYDEDPSNRARLRTAVQVFSDQLGGSLKGKRILDMGCLEGKFSVEFARHGATVVSVDAREANIEKARFAAQVLKLPITFLQVDVSDIQPDSLGKFDGVFCAGLFYHLNVNHAFKLLSLIKALTAQVAIIETCYALNFDERAVVNGVTYYGESYVEFTESEFNPETVEGAAWSSTRDKNVFFFTERSLVRAIQNAGFSSVYKALVPNGRSVENRDFFVARIGQTLPVLTGHDFFRDMPEQPVRELSSLPTTNPGKGRSLHNPESERI